MKKFTFLLFLVCGVMACKAQTFVENGITYSVLTDSTVAVASNKGAYAGAVTVPATVTHNDSAFHVVAVAARAFQASKELTSVTLPESVTTLGNYAFNQCTALTTVHLPEGLTEVPNYTFYFCTSLTSVNIPDGITRVGRSAFSYCTALSNVTLPATCTELGGSAFLDCGLTKFEVPQGVTLIPSYCFSSCVSLSKITLPSSLDSIAADGFQACSSLTSITLPASLHGMGTMAFASCSGLVSVTVPDGVAYVGNQCFYNCPNLQRVTLGKGVRSLGSDVFTKYKNTASLSLKDLYLFSPIVLGGGTGFDESLYAMTTIHVPESLLDQYKTAEGWSRFSIVGMSDAEVTGINGVSQAAGQASPRYNLGGVKLSGKAQGLYIQNGKKYIQK